MNIEKNRRKRGGEINVKEGLRLNLATDQDNKAHKNG